MEGFNPTCTQVRTYVEIFPRGTFTTSSLEEICADIKDRDYRDMHREIAPLKQAEDAILVDSSNMTIDEVVAEILKLVKEKQQ